VRDLAEPGDYTGFVHFGNAALAGLVPYDAAVQASFMPGLWATWPPSFAPIAALLALADRFAHAPAVLVWQSLNAAGLLFVLWVWRDWLGGSDRDPARGPTWASPWLLVPLVVPLRLVLSNFEHAQANLLVLALVALAFRLFDARRRGLGGLAFGLATAFKGTPLIVLFYLALRGRWADLRAAALGWGVAWLLLPLFLLGPDGLGRWYAGWAAIVREAAAVTAFTNQSLLSVLSRRLTAGAAGLTVPADTAAIIGIGAALLAATAAAVALGRPGRRGSREREAVELAAVLVLMSLVSPLAWKAHYVTLVPLSAALFHLGRSSAAATGRGRRPDCWA